MWGIKADCSHISMLKKDITPITVTQHSLSQILHTVKHALLKSQPAVWSIN